MDADTVMQIGRQALVLALELSAPVLLTAMAVGLVVSVFQAATQIQESTLSFAPKLAGVAVVLMVAGIWMIGRMSQFATELLGLIPQVGS